MIETGKSFTIIVHFFILLLISCFTAQISEAQDFTLEATVSENKIFIGEQFTVRIEVSGSSMRDVSLPVMPTIDGIGILSSTPSRSTSISIVNGRTTTSIGYTFALIAREKGNFTIPPITIEIDGETHSTNSIPVEVIERGNLSPENGRQLPDIFLEVEIGDTEPVPGQQLVAALVLYFKQGIEITSFQPTSGWRTDGFWKEELQNIREPQAESTIMNGVRYRKATLMRYALFPSRSGTLTLTEFPLTVGIRTRPSRNDPFGSFFGSGGNQRRVTVESEPIELNVRSLPDFENAISMNAVGDLRITRELNLDEVETGESIELITKVEGTVNIPLVRKPTYNLPDGLHLFTPQETSNIERRGLNIRGDKTFTEMMVARAPGRYEIPAERVAVFDPSNNRYRYINLPALEFEAVPSATQQIASSRSITGGLQPVSGLAVWNSADSRPFFQNTIFWVLLVIPFLGLMIGLQQKQFRNKLKTDSTFARAHTASEKAKQRIHNARNAVQNKEPKECYNILHKAITGFISDKLSLPQAGFSDHDLVQKVREKGVDSTIIKSLQATLNKCATISYAPVGNSDDQLLDIEKTEKLISDLKKAL